MSDEKITSEPNKGSGEKIDAKESKEKVDVTKLTDNEIRWREKYKLNKSELEAERAKAESEKQRSLEQVTEMSVRIKNMEQTVIDTEVQRAATAAGIRDLEFVKLIDKSQIKMVDGKIEGAETAINELKTRKPDWFNAEKKANTSSGANFNRDGGNSKQPARSAWDMNKAEYTTAKADLTRGRYR